MDRRFPLAAAVALGASLAAASAGHAQQTAPEPAQTAPATDETMPSDTAPSVAPAPPAPQSQGKARGQGHLVQMFKKVDKNGDGVVEKAEYDNGRLRLFERYDTNKDGRITSEEIIAIASSKGWPDARRDKLIKRMGITTPQGITKDEYLGQKTVFVRIDTNGDGKVTMAEVEMFAKKMQQRKAAKQSG